MNPETTTEIEIETKTHEDYLKSGLMELLNMFVSKDDELHPELAKPFRIYEYAAASDGHAMIWFSATANPKLRLRKADDEAEYLGYVHPKANFTESFSVESLRLAIDKAEYEEELIETEAILCKECNGAGEVEWTYGDFEKMRNCPICDGSGDTMKVEKTGKMIPCDGQYIQLGISAFEAKQLIRLQELATRLHVYTILHTPQTNPLAGIKFLVGFVSVLIMPCLVGVDYQNQIIAKINPL